MSKSRSQSGWYTLVGYCVLILLILSTAIGIYQGTFLRNLVYLDLVEATTSGSDLPLSRAIDRLTELYDSGNAVDSDRWRLGGLLFGSGDREQALAVYASARTLSNIRPEYGWLRGMVFLKDQDGRSALREFRAALIRNPELWDSQLARIYYEAVALEGIKSSDLVNSTGDLPKQPSDYLSVRKLNTPGFRTGDIAIPEWLVSHIPCVCQLHLKYDQWAVDAGPLVSLALDWRGTEKSVQRERFLARNLVLNAGFDWDLLDKSFGPIVGFPLTLYGGDPIWDTHALVDLSEPDKAGYGASLKNSPSAMRSSLVTAKLPVSPGETYLYVARMRSEDGNAFVGVQWFAADGKEVRTDYLVTEWLSNEWQTIGKLLDVPESAEFAEIRLINFESAGSVEFEEVLFVDIPLPTIAETEGCT